MASDWKRLFETAHPDIDEAVVKTIDRWLFSKRLPSLILPQVQAVAEADYRVSLWHKILICLTGEGTILYPGGSFRYRPGQIAIIPARFPHRTESQIDRGRHAHLLLAPKNGTIYYNVYLHTEDHVNKPVGGRYRDIQKSAIILAILDELVSGRKRSAVVSEGLIRSLAGLLKDEFSRPRNSVSSPLVARCRSFVEQELCDPALSVTAAAKELRVHPDYLSRSFHSEAGVRLVSYIQFCRIQLARELLSGGKLYATEVSHLVGFSDPGYFTKVFRRMTGVTPSEFRQRAVTVAREC